MPDQSQDPKRLEAMRAMMDPSPAITAQQVEERIREIEAKNNDLAITVKIGDKEHAANISEKRKEKAVEFLWMLEQIKDRLGSGSKSDLAAAEIMKTWLNSP